MHPAASRFRDLVPAFQVPGGRFHLAGSSLREGACSADPEAVRERLGLGQRNGGRTRYGHHTIGPGTITPQYYVDKPVQTIVGTATSIAAGSETAYALKADGTVWAWGHGSSGELGNGTTPYWSASPVQVTGLSGVVAIAATSGAGFAVKNDGTAWAWGFRQSLGNGAAANSSVPVRIAGLTGVTKISGRDHGGYALRNDGTVWAWGRGANGALGNGGATDSGVPVQVTGLTGATSIAGSDDNGFALISDGTVRAWGRGPGLGNGSTTDSLVPTPVPALTGVKAIAGGSFVAYALLDDGTVRAWGAGTYGQLGNGSTSVSLTPVQVANLTNVASISAGIFDGYAVKTDGTAWGWGSNLDGELGNGLAPSTSLVPTQVVGLTGVKSIAGGWYNAYALLG